MSYDLSSYCCVVCRKPITMKEFADGKAGPNKPSGAIHEDCK